MGKWEEVLSLTCAPFGAAENTGIAFGCFSHSVYIYIYIVRSESGTKQERLWVGSYIAFGTCCMIPVYSYILRYASI